jgi:hypothetical protein
MLYHVPPAMLRVFEIKVHCVAVLFRVDTCQFDSTLGSFYKYLHYCLRASRRFLKLVKSILSRKS